ncbi:MAG: hypothetical protein EAZ95_17710 [Bacteroidetes bacterium]|nr:MAG: hypothetical protein EAZ95_17710 [Bacteroidota bacterium]
MRVNELSLEMKWDMLLANLQKLVGKRPADIDAVLFLIGIQELGQGIRTFSKEQKQDLMHIATCKVLSYAGIYELEGSDAEGWPHWKQVLPLPHLTLEEQENLLRTHVLEYFEEAQLF